MWKHCVMRVLQIPLSNSSFNDVTLHLEISHSSRIYTIVVSLLTWVQLFATPWTVARQALLSMGCSRQEYWSGFPRPPPGDVPDPGIEPRSSALWTDSLPSLSHFAFQQRVSQHCKSTILQFFKKQLKNHLRFAHSSPFSLTPGKH